MVNLKDLAAGDSRVEEYLNSDMNHVKTAKAINTLYKTLGFTTSERSVRRWRRANGTSQAEMPLHGSVSHAKTSVASALGLVNLTGEQPDSGPQDATTEVENIGDHANTLIIDIETSPVIAAVWDIWNPKITPDHIIQDKQMICFAAKFLHNDEIYFYSVYHHGKETMLRNLHFLLDRADIVIHFNGNTFDDPIINAELLMAGYEPPSPRKTIDVYKELKKVVKFTSNSMDYICKKIGLTGKTSKLSILLWLRCMEDDEDAWNEMMKYNIGDIWALQELYLYCYAWIKHPNAALFAGREFACPACGSEDVVRKGYAYTNTGKFRQYKCKNCGKWSKDRLREFTTILREV